NAPSIPSATRNEASETTRATARAWTSLAPRHRGRTGIPTSGRKIRTVSQGMSGPQSQEQEERYRAEQERERVRTHEPALDPRGDPGRVDHVSGDLVHRPVDHAVVHDGEGSAERLPGMLDTPRVE